MFKEELEPTLPKENRRGGNTSELIFSPNTKTRQRYHKEKKIETNIPYECRCKNPCQNLANQIQQNINRIIYYN